MIQVAFYLFLIAVAVGIAQITLPALTMIIKPQYPLQGDVENYGRGYKDIIEIIILCVSQLFLRYSVWNFMIRPFALAFGMTKRIKQDKFITATWITVCYLILFQFGVRIAWEEPWWPYDTANFPNMAAHLVNGKVSGLMKHYYLLQLSYYATLTIMLFRDVRKKDHAMMLSHHVITFLLIAGSYCVKGTAIGIVTLLYFDVGDIFLYAGKCFDYSKARFASIVAFITFVLVWIITRHYFFPFMLMEYGLEVYQNTLPHVSNIIFSSYITLYTLEWVIEIFSIIWFRKIMLFLYKVLTTGDIKDPSSDTDTDEDTVNDVNKPMVSGPRLRRRTRK